MFNFFKRNSNDDPQAQEKQSEEEALEEEPVASVTYYIRQDSPDIFLDIFIADYEDETLQKMAKILSGLSSLRLSVETMSMVKDSLVDAGAQEVFLNLVKHTMEYTKNDTDSLKQLSDKIKEATKEKDKEDEPWIKPSDIIR